MANQVTLQELNVIWMRDDAISLVLDEKRGVRIVRLIDGTEYEAPTK